MSNTKFYPIINKNESYKLELKDICFIYRANRILRFDTMHGVIHTYDKIDNVEKYLGPEFYRCLSGCIVNVTKIKKMKKLIVYFEAGESLKLGKEAFLRVKQRFNAYMLGLLRESDDQDDPDDNGGK